MEKVGWPCTMISDDSSPTRSSCDITPKLNQAASYQVAARSFEGDGLDGYGVWRRSPPSA
jgi:hypothetical protein